MKVVLVDYGAGNLRSVCSALGRAGAEAVVSADPALTREADLAVIAGVGHLAACAEGLEREGLAEALRDRVASGRPVLGICVGLQMLFEESEEGGEGLGFFKGPVVRLQARRVPHMGWNTLSLRGKAALMEGLDGEDVYFAHSYTARPVEELVGAEVEHGGPVIAAVERGALAGVQFHPERSGSAGARLLRNVIEWSRSA
ncbi:MAG: imidazole glycerol phosphate synthase subunit HisH [Gaiellaceae bacterium]|jgi:glutamine amidotransferase